MTTLPYIMHKLALGFALLATPLALFCLIMWLWTSHGWRLTFATLRQQYRKLTPMGRFIAIALLAVFLVKGSTKSNSHGFSSPTPPPAQQQSPVPPAPEPLPAATPPTPLQLSTNQYRAGFALVSVTTNAAAWAERPANAVTYERWTRYGVANDLFWLACAPGATNTSNGTPSLDWSYTLGANQVEGVYIATTGTLSFDRPKGSPTAREMPDPYGISFLAPLQTHIGIVPPAGQFWYAITATNTLLCTWQNVYFGRLAEYPISFQIELWPHGDFVYRYNLASLPNNQLFTDHPPPTTNFVIGAQHNHGGETFTLGDTNAVVHGLNLHWRAFGVLDPTIDDHDGDGLSTYDEVMLYGTNPGLTDTDGDGLSDYDEIFVYGTDPRNPDTDGDGVPDGMTQEQWYSHDYFAPGNDKRMVQFSLRNAFLDGCLVVLRCEDLPLIMSETSSFTIYLNTGTVCNVELVVLGNPIGELTLTATPGVFVDDPNSVLHHVTTYNGQNNYRNFTGNGYFKPIWNNTCGASFSLYCCSTIIFPNPIVLHEENERHIALTMFPPTFLPVFVEWATVNSNHSNEISFNSTTGQVTIVRWKSSTMLGSIDIQANVTDTQGGVVIATGVVYKCHNAKPLHWSRASTNFSPHLYEEVELTISAGCEHLSGYENSWLEIEIGRSAINGWQHLDWLAAGPATVGPKKRFKITESWRSSDIRWNGVVSANLEEAMSPDIFSYGTPPFNRILPSTFSGAPAPPPFFDIVARIRNNNSDNSIVLAEATCRIFIPQVVKINWTTEIVDLFAQPIDFQHNHFPTNLYSGTTLELAEDALESLSGKVKAMFPSGLNMRVINHRQASRGNIIEVNIENSGSIKKPFGESVRMPFPNRMAHGINKIYLNECKNEIYYTHGYYVDDLTDYNPNWHKILFPLTKECLASFLADVVTHEVGHTLGLVDQNHLSGSKLRHNKFDAPQYIMNRGELTDMEWYLGVHPLRTWHWRNKLYLEFLLPEEVEQ